MSVLDLEPFSIDYSSKCRIFLDAWRALSETSMLKELARHRWYDSDYIVYRYPEGTLEYDKEKEIIVGKPGERWTEYLNSTRNFFQKFLEDKKHLDINRLSKLLNTDLTCLDEEDKYPNITNSSKHPNPLLCLFRTSRIVAEAYEKNKNKIERIISQLKNIQ